MEIASIPSANNHSDVLTKHVPAAVLDRHLATLGLVDYSHDGVTGVQVDQQKLAPGVKNLIWGKFSKHFAWKPSLGLSSILAVPVRALEKSDEDDPRVLVSWFTYWIVLHILASIGLIFVVMKLRSCCRRSPVVEIAPAVFSRPLSHDRSTAVAPAEVDLEPTVVSTSSSSGLLTRAYNKVYFTQQGACVHMDPACSGMSTTLQVERRCCKKCWK